jgi:hypothetical protein
VAGTEPVKGLDACVGLLTIQLKSLATNSYIFGAVIALCLLTLITIVIAGGHVSFKGPANIEGDISPANPTPVTVVNPPDAPVPVQPQGDSQ